MRRALITGITGQDAAYLAQFLCSKGYEVYGAHRRSASLNLWRLQELGLADRVHLVPMDLLEMTNILRALERTRPTEVYNLAAQSFVAASFEQPVYTCDVDALGPIRLLEAIRQVNPEIRFYQASSSEMFGRAKETPQNELTPFYPRSPYGIAKVCAHWATVNYREAFGMYAACGILFNHESPLRGLEFVTRKITAGLARIKHGQQSILELGNLDARRDWGFAGDYVRAMWMMLQQDEPDDYVIATGKCSSVREFVDLAAAETGFALEWTRQNNETVAVESTSRRIIIRVNPGLHRPTEVDILVGDSRKAHARLGWEPTMSLHELVRTMARADLTRAQKGVLFA